jgi:hypothetical protein
MVRNEVKGLRPKPSPSPIKAVMGIHTMNKLKGLVVIMRYFVAVMHGNITKAGVNRQTTVGTTDKGIGVIHPERDRILIHKVRSKGEKKTSRHG